MLKRFMPGPVLLATLLALVLVLWMASGTMYAFGTQAPEAEVPPAADEEVEATLRSVETYWSQARPHAPRLTLQGQVEPWQQVEVAAQVAATVEAWTVPLGARVAAGAVFVRLSEDARGEQVARHEADVRRREHELTAIERLRAGNMQSESEAFRLRSELASARAELAAARLALAHTRPGAPFEAIVDHRLVDVGDFVQPGTPLARLVAVDRLKVVAQVPQQQVARLQPGQQADVVLLDGRRLTGRLAFVASAAEAGTRSFRIEVHADNPALWRVAGGSATVEVHLAPVQAHRITPALLALDASGQLGVYRVDEAGRMRFAAVQLLSVTDEGAWVSGLDERVRLISRGAGFIEPGERVHAVDRAQAGDREE